MRAALKLLMASVSFGLSAQATSQGSIDPFRELIPNEPIATGPLGDGYGHRVAIDANTAAVSAWSRTVVDTPSVQLTGLLFVFQRDASGAWKQQAKLSYAPPRSWSGNFARELALDGDTLITTAFENLSGNEVHVFQRDANGVWGRRTILYANQAVADPVREWWGSAIDVDGETIAVASGGYDYSIEEPPPVSGPVSIYVRATDGLWRLQSSIRARDQWTGDGFGWLTGYWNGSAMSLVGDTLYVGAPRAFNDAGVETGAVYVFRRSAGGEWAQRAKIVPPSGGQQWNEFGTAVSAFDASTVLIGAPGVGDQGPNSGAAYIFSKDSSGNWSSTGKLLQPIDEENDYDYFGSRLSLDGRTRATVATEFGEAYIFERTGSGAWNQVAHFADATPTTYVSVAMSNGTSVIGSVASDRTLLYDLPPLEPRIDLIAGDNCINAIEAGRGVEIKGRNAEPGSTVTTILGGISKTAKGGPDSTWSTSYSSAEIQPIPQGDVVLQAFQKDLGGGLSGIKRRTICKDTIRPTAPVINPVTGDNIVNANERTKGLVIIGVGEPGAAMTVVVGAIRKHLEAAPGTGQWRALLTAAEAQALPRGSVDVRAIARDKAGNARGAHLAFTNR